MSADTTSIPTTPPPPVGFYEAFIYWLKLGFISFGGPAGQITMMHDELVKKRRWISEHRFLHALSYCNVLPGPEAQQLATYIGWLMHGTWGGIVAGAMFVLPSFFVLSALSWVYMDFGDVKAVIGILDGIKPAVIAIIIFAGYRIGSRALKNAWLWAIALAAFIAIYIFKVPFPYIVIAAALIGYFGGRIAPNVFKGGGHHGTNKEEYGPAIIDDTTPIPAHAHLDWSRVIRFVVIGLTIWVLSLGLLYNVGGWQGVYTQMGWFFTKAALFTFGGAYAVLPYVQQAGVEHYQWLSHEQMMTGLALGETTPGPLIMVVAYVGFVGAWTKQVLGADSLLLAGIIGASVATFFTFLPSFLFILVGGPAVEATRHDMKFTAPLIGITAAVVGVILNLAVYFAYHVLWKNGIGGSFEWFSAGLCLVAFIALWRFKIDIIPVILASGVIGLVSVFIKPLII